MGPIVTVLVAVVFVIIVFVAGYAVGYGAAEDDERDRRCKD